MKNNILKESVTHSSHCHFNQTFSASIIMSREGLLSEDEFLEAWRQGNLAFGRSDYDEDNDQEFGCLYFLNRQIGYYTFHSGITEFNRQFEEMKNLMRQRVTCPETEENTVEGATDDMWG